MNGSSPKPDDLWDRIARYADGKLGAEEVALLESQLREDPAALEQFTLYMELHARLMWESRARGDSDDETATENRLSLARRLPRKVVAYVSRRVPFSITIAALAVITIVGVMWFMAAPYYRAVAEREEVERAETLGIVARLTGLQDAEWGQGQHATHLGAFLQRGQRMELTTGLAEVTYDNGTIMLLQGPCDFTVTASRAAALARGSLTARVPPEAIGFVVSTPTAEITDLGTQFGVAVDDNKLLFVEVYEGSVEAQAKSLDGSHHGEVQRLTAGQARRLTPARQWSRAPAQARRQLVRVLPRKLNVAQANYEGTLDNGFPYFLSPETVNATTRAWNFGGSQQTLNGVTLHPGSNSVDGLKVVGQPDTYSASALQWTGDPQAAEKNDISNTGLFSVAPNSWGVAIEAVPGRRYRLQLLSNAVAGAPIRRSYVMVDDQRIARELFVPPDRPWSVVYTLEVVADDDTLDLEFVPGVKDHTNPYVTAIAVTELPAVSADSEASP